MSSVHASPVQTHTSALPTDSFIDYATLPTYSSIQYSNLPTYSTVPLPIPWVTGPATYPGTHGHTCDEGMIHRIILSICIPLLVLWTVLFVLVRRLVIRRRNRSCKLAKGLDAEEGKGGQIKLPDSPELVPTEIFVSAEEEFKEHGLVPAKQVSFLNDREALAEEQPLLGKNGSDSDSD